MNGGGARCIRHHEVVTPTVVTSVAQVAINNGVICISDSEDERPIKREVELDGSNRSDVSLERFLETVTDAYRILETVFKESEYQGAMRAVAEPLRRRTGYGGLGEI